MTHYKTRLEGTPRRCITMHLHRDARVRPERLAKARAPDTIVYAWRLDRGAERAQVLRDESPGTRWDEEQGLDEHQYIVPGAGGVGELLSSAPGW